MTTGTSARLGDTNQRHLAIYTLDYTLMSNAFFHNAHNFGHKVTIFF